MSRLSCNLGEDITWDKAGNREINETSDASGPLGYDFKGNVTSRPPLFGGNAYTHTWDAFDRMTSVARTGQTTVNFKYDAMGRLLMRDQGSDDQVFYWLGLNCSSDS